MTIADQRGWKARLRPSRAALLGWLIAGAGCGVTSPLFVAESDAPFLPDASVAQFDAWAGGPPPGYTGLPCGTGRGCNTTHLGGESCQSLGAGSGRLLCDPVSCTFDLSLCNGFPDRPPCGTGPGCNPRDLGGQTCESLGLPAGEIACDPVTCTVDTTMCIGVPGTTGLFGGAVDDDAGMEPPMFGGMGTPGGGTTGVFGGGGTSGGTGIFGGGGASGGGTGIFGGSGTFGGIFGGGDDMDAGTD